MDHKILIVESDPPSASRVVRALRTAGFRVVAPARPTTTLATFDRVRPDLVLIGSSLPDDGGARLCQAIKNTPHGSRTPVALLVDDVEIDRPPLADLGWDRLIESATANEDLVATCRQMIRAKGTLGIAPAAPPPAAVEPDSDQPVTGDRSLEEAIDQVLTFEHEETVAHLQRSAARPVAPESVASDTQPVAPAPAVQPAPKPERLRYQTAALVGTQSRVAEQKHEKPAPQPAAPVPRGWWAVASVGVGAVALIAIGAWSFFSGGKPPQPVAAPTFALATPAGGGNTTEPGQGTAVAASLVPPVLEEIEEAPAEQPAPPPEPSTVAPKPVQPKPAPVKTTPKPVEVKTSPPPEPEPVEVKTPPPQEPEPVEVETPARALAEPEPEPAAVEREPAAEEPTPEPVEAETPPPPEPEPEPAPAPAEPAPLVEPFLLQRVDPAPSPKALKKDRGASVVLRLLVNEQGNVIRVVVDQGIPGSELEAAAVNAVLRWKYRPATRDGVPEQAWTRARFDF